MPITRRRRTNPPDRPENNNNHSAASTEQTGETPVTDQPATVGETEHAALMPGAPAIGSVENVAEPSFSTEPPVQSSVQTPSPSITPATNGERSVRQEHTPPIESGRRTARGELFRRPPQAPAQLLPPTQIMPPTPSQPLQPPACEISLPLGNLLHLAYNPGYTGAEESRSQLLQQLAQESKNGGRARCWSCGAIAIVYDRWNTRSKNFGDVGVAICEICGVWSVM